VGFSGKLNITKLLLQFDHKTRKFVQNSAQVKKDHEATVVNLTTPEFRENLFPEATKIPKYVLNLCVKKRERGYSINRCNDDRT
jgi:hypothetical protein